MKLINQYFIISDINFAALGDKASVLEFVEKLKVSSSYYNFLKS